MAKKSKDFGKLLGQEKISPDISPSDRVRQSVPSDFLVAEADNFEKIEARIREIVGVDEKGEILNVEQETLEIYQNYLKEHLTFPVVLTGNEDFDWEEYYVIGPGSQKEHKKLRETRPSYLDTYELLKFEEKIENSWDGLLVVVRRLEDGKKFTLPLGDLKANDRSSPNYQPIDDYVTWFVNWR